MAGKSKPVGVMRADKPSQSPPGEGEHSQQRGHQAWCHQECSTGCVCYYLCKGERAIPSWRGLFHLPKFTLTLSEGAPHGAVTVPQPTPVPSQHWGQQLSGETSGVGDGFKAGMWKKACFFPDVFAAGMIRDQTPLPNTA